MKIGKHRCRFQTVFLVISLLVNAFSAYRLLDMGVTSTYASVEIQLRAVQLSELQRLLPEIMPDVSRSELITTAQAAGLDIIEKADEVYVGQTLFIISDGQVSKVDFSLQGALRVDISTGWMGSVVAKGGAVIYICPAVL